MSRRAAKSVFDSPAFKAGVPMLAFMLGGSYVLSEFMQTHMELKDKKVESRSMRKFDMDKEHAGMLQKLQVRTCSAHRIRLDYILVLVFM